MKYTRIKPIDNTCTFDDSFYKDLSVHRLTGLHESQSEEKILLICVCKERSSPESLAETCDYSRVVLVFKRSTEFDVAVPPLYVLGKMIIFFHWSFK